VGEEGFHGRKVFDFILGAAKAAAQVAGILRAVVVQVFSALRSA